MHKYAAELVGLAPDVIVATGNSDTGPLQEATRMVPIVFALVPDPVGAGFVDEFGPAWRQRHRVHKFRVRHDRKVAGTA